MTIPGDQNIEPGMIVRHDDGLLYEVEDTRICTDDYETTHRLGDLTVNYTATM